MLLLKCRLTQVSDFFPGEGDRKKNKKVFQKAQNIFKKVPDFSPEFP